MTNSNLKNQHIRRKGDQKKSLQSRSLQLLNAYRLIIAALLFSFNFIEISFIGRIEPSQLFFSLSTFYLIYSVSAFIVSTNKLLKLNTQVHINVLVDVILTTLFTLNAGGIDSGWGTLILAPIAGASLLLPGQTALLFASYGTVGLILQELYGDLSGVIINTSYTQSGLLGVALFAIAFLAISLAKRVTESTALAEKRGIDLANLSQLNDHLINRIESGIIVVDEDNSIKLMNRAATELLGIRQNTQNIKLGDTSRELLEIHSNWLNNDSSISSQDFFEIKRKNLSSLRARITKVGARVEDKGSVIYISDSSDLNRQIQESKLASLGRLTASIAHEIRNPLGAISHAAQLLDESDNLSADNKRLADIIYDQTNRLNKIIESVLRLSRKESASIEPVALDQWLNKFVSEFQEFNEVDENWCKINLAEEDIVVYTDINHLHQVLWNLCTNAIKYAANKNQQSSITLNAYTDNTSSTSYLDVVDNGPGINSVEQEKLFEPFYTTSTTGTGLGLYISRELCLSYGGDLTYSNSIETGSCFRIRFAQKPL
ncbi:MAG: ATP-binding protein [Gammaproteobacteria bacterium]|nr:ATP-binding protein [Gammaproteobacteria bacterium]